MTKYYFHPMNGFIEINTQLNLFLLNKQEWKDDLSKICLKNEVKLNQTDLFSFSSSFTASDRMYLILTKCNPSLNLTVSLIFKENRLELFISNRRVI